MTSGRGQECCPPLVLLGLELGPDSYLGLSAPHKCLPGEGADGTEAPLLPVPSRYPGTTATLHLPEPWLFHCPILSPATALALAGSTPRRSSCSEQASLSGVKSWAAGWLSVSPGLQVPALTIACSMPSRSFSTNSLALPRVKELVSVSSLHFDIL